MSMYKRFAATLLAATILAQPVWAAPPLPAGQDPSDAEFGPPVAIQGVTSVRVSCRGQVFTLKVHSTTLSDEYMVAADNPELARIARLFNTRLEWDGSSRTLTSVRDKDFRFMKEGQDRVTHRESTSGSQEAELPLASQMVDGAVNIPLSALEEFLDVRVTVRPNNLVFIEPLIRNVHFDSVNGKARLVVDSTAPVNYKSFQLKSPDRYVIDISGAVLDTSGLSVNHPELGNVRLGQFELGPAISRIVVPLPSGAQVHAAKSGQGQSLAFAMNIPGEPSGPAVVAENSNPNPEPAAPPQPKPHFDVVQIPHYPSLRPQPKHRPGTVQIPHYPSMQLKHPVEVVQIPHYPNQGNVAPPPAPNNPPPAAPSEDSGFTTISGVSWNKTATGAKLVLNANGPLSYEWQRLPDNRLVLDIPNVLLSDPKQEYPGNGETISAVRLVQNQPLPNPVVRVVMDATKPLKVNIVKGESENTMVMEVADNDPYPPNRGSGSTGRVAQVPGTGRGLIVLDPGHGGSDVGAQNRALGLNEATVTLDICKRLAIALREQGWNVIMTRTENVDVSYWGSSATEELGARVKVANERKADIFLSVHCNASVSSSSSGTSIHYYKQGDYVFAHELQSNVINATGCPNRGLQANRFYVLTHTQMPAVLVETAFISNSSEGSKLGDPNFRQRVADGLAQGVRQYASRNLNWTAAKP